MSMSVGRWRSCWHICVVATSFWVWRFDVNVSSVGLNICTSVCFDFSGSLLWAEPWPRWVRIDWRSELISCSLRSSKPRETLSERFINTQTLVALLLLRRQSAAPGLISKDTSRLPYGRVCQENGKCFWLKKITGFFSGEPRGDTDRLLVFVPTPKLWTGKCSMEFGAHF